MVDTQACAGEARAGEEVLDQGGGRWVTGNHLGAWEGLGLTRVSSVCWSELPQGFGWGWEQWVLKCPGVLSGRVCRVNPPPPTPSLPGKEGHLLGQQ